MTENTGHRVPRHRSPASGEVALLCPAHWACNHWSRNAAHHLSHLPESFHDSHAQHPQGSFLTVSSSFENAAHHRQLRRHSGESVPPLEPQKAHPRLLVPRSWNSSYQLPPPFQRAQHCPQARQPKKRADLLHHEAACPALPQQGASDDYPTHYPPRVRVKSYNQTGPDR